MKNDILTVTSPLLPDLDEFHDMLKEIWKSKWITNNGQLHQQLEKELAEYLKVPYLSLFTNGTLPLITALQALRITGEVITTIFFIILLFIEKVGHQVEKMRETGRLKAR